MAIVPRYEQQVEIGNIPSVRQAAIATTTGLEGAGYKALGEAGEKLASFGNDVFKIALQKQDEDNKAQFVKAKTDREIFVQNTLQQYSNWDSHKWGEVAPDFIKAVDEYDKNAMKNMPNNSLKKSYSNMISLTAPSMNEKLYGISEKMRLDANNADYTDSMMKLINARNFDGAREVIEVSSWNASEKEKMRLKVDEIERKEHYQDTAKSLFTESFFDATKGDPNIVKQAIAKASNGDRDLADYLEQEWKPAFSDYNHAKNIRIENQLNKVYEGFDNKLSYGKMKQLIASMPDLDAKQKYQLNDLNESIHEVGRHAPKRSSVGYGDTIEKAFITDSVYEGAYGCKNKEEFLAKYYPLVTKGIITASNYIKASKRVGKLDPALWDGKMTDVKSIIENYFTNSGNKDLKFDYNKMGAMLTDIQKECKRRGVTDVIGVALAMYKPKKVKAEGGWFSSNTNDSYSGIAISKANRELSKRGYLYSEEHQGFIKVEKLNGGRKQISSVGKKEYQNNIKPILEKNTPKKTIPKKYNKDEDDE